jgi:hypothetical protein
MSRSSSSIGIPQIWSTAIRPYAVEGVMGAQYWHKVASIRRGNLIAYWPNWEVAGTDVNDYSGLGDRATSTGLGIRAAGSDCFHQTPVFNANPAHINILSAEFLAHFNPLEFTLLGWARTVSTARWIDASHRWITKIYTDANNQSNVLKSNVDYTLQFQHIAGGVVSEVLFADPTLTAAWFMYGLTVSKSANQLRAYYKGAQVGATQAVAGVYAGALTLAVIGAYDLVHTFPWLGYIDHYAAWNVPLSAPEIAQFSEV